MKYRLIHKCVTTQPKSGSYTDWKIQVSDECFKQCVYCAISETNWGGIDHYHIDHFRPRSKFAELENDICNLFYACPVCNRFKNDDWPAEPDLNIPSYPDPSLTNYDTLFDVCQENFYLDGRNVAAKYLITRLFLNRAQLLYERREASLKLREKTAFDAIVQLALQSSDMEVIKRTFNLISVLKDHLSKRDAIRPYKLAEIRRN